LPHSGACGELVVAFVVSTVVGLVTGATVLEVVVEESSMFLDVVVAGAYVDGGLVEVGDTHILLEHLRPVSQISQSEQGCDSETVFTQTGALAFVSQVRPEAHL
jgi:hypothetical protein